jgi:integrase
MACIRERRGKWTLDYRDAFGRRRWQTFPLTPDGYRLAEIEKGKILAQSGRRGETVYDPDITLDAYADTWLKLVSVRLGPSTIRNYSTGLRLHVLPLLGRFRLRDLSRPRLKLWVADVRSRLAPGSVGVLIGMLQSLFNGAVEDGVLDANPARGLPKIMGLTTQRRDEEIHAFTSDQLEAFRQASGPLAFPFTLYSYTGMRLGEGLALQWEDVNLEDGYVLVRRQLMWNSGGMVRPPKTRRGHRRIDLADALRESLRDEQARQRAEGLKHRRHSPWVLFPEWGPPPVKESRAAAERLQIGFKRVLKRAGLPQHLSIHSLRHTYATLLLQRGESIQYVCDQLGHSSIKITFDLYGRWLPMRATAGGANLLQRAPAKKAQES